MKTVKKSTKFVKELFDQGRTVPWNTSNKDLNTLYSLILRDELNKKEGCFSFGDYLTFDDNDNLILALGFDNDYLDLEVMHRIKNSIRASLKNEVEFLFNEEQERRENENYQPEYNPDLSIERFI